MPFAAHIARLFENSPALLGVRWYPIEGMYGLLPLLAGSFIVTIGAG
ncbi:MAG: hypothetical protein R2911_43285 [Caldilineaceae bacterium]